PRAALARAAAAWHRAQPEHVVAVTGTNGKTSVATFLRQIWCDLGLSAVNFGTTGVEGVVEAPLTHTTPEPIELHALLARLAGEGVTHAAMEASSHGLEQRRLDGVRLAAAAFTNLSRDHLDYHPTFEAYEAAKRGLFDRVLPPEGLAVIATDDPTSARFAAAAQDRGQRVVTVGRSREADLRLLETRFTPSGQLVRFAWDGAEEMRDLPLIGSFQASNVLVAAALAVGTGAAVDGVFTAMERLKTVRGRMEHVATRPNGAPLYVDYSHTPGSLSTALTAIRPHVAGRLVVVFGAGGDRDPGKRVLMGRAAADCADIAILTDDNPRSEDPAKIRAMVREGAPEAIEIGDRAEAIAHGASLLGPDDLLLIAGKGHETGQTVGDTVLPFDDREEAIRAVTNLDGGTS
ncbi:MAG: UDP-N-acetylmuramoyl-L-alanyl-D-glutamate--2,6-diaminopimelate ligase, partial [Pseudomonadota bacterium]